MKLMIASDLHGSSHFVQKLMERFEAEQPDKLLQKNEGNFPGGVSGKIDGSRWWCNTCSWRESMSPATGRD